MWWEGPRLPSPSLSVASTKSNAPPSFGRRACAPRRENRAIWSTALTAGSQLMWCTVLKLPPEGAEPFTGNVHYGGKNRTERSLPPLLRAPLTDGDAGASSEGVRAGFGQYSGDKRMRTEAPEAAPAATSPPAGEARPGQRAATKKRARSTGGADGEPRRQVRSRLTTDADEEAPFVDET